MDLSNQSKTLLNRTPSEQKHVRFREDSLLKGLFIGIGRFGTTGYVRYRGDSSLVQYSPVLRCFIVHILLHFGKKWIPVMKESG